MTNSNRSVPIHFWIVAVVSLLWNAVGAFDYLATKLQLEFYVSQFNEEQMAYFLGVPAWMTVCWAFGVWGAVTGSVGLVLRKKWAVLAFAISLLGLAGSTVYSHFLSNGGEIMGTGGMIFSAVIWAIAIALVIYSNAMARRGILN